MTKARRALGVLGMVMATAFFLWIPLGWLGAVPSMLDVYGIAGLRVPASVAIGGLLIAALGFYEL